MCVELWFTISQLFTFFEVSIGMVGGLLVSLGLNPYGPYT